MGLGKLTALWGRVRDSLWFLPSVMTVAAIALAIVTIQLDLAGVADVPEPDESAEGPGPLRLLFSGTPDGARQILSAIASGLITVTGVVFSVTIVALQLASTQFTPRILRNFTADRGNQVVLGMFIATFTYALLVLRVVRGDEGVGAFVPNLSLTVAMTLTLVSIGFLIFFINHAARSVQASVIIDRVSSDALRTISQTLPGDAPGLVRDDVERHVPRGQGTIVAARTTGYLQGVDEEALMDLLDAEAYTIRMEPAVGDFVMAGAALVTLWPAGPGADSDVADEIRSAFILGFERTPHMDAELPVVELSDIAVKALSPGINDPTTATHCLDRLAEIVVEFGRREPPPRVHIHPTSGGVLILPRIAFEHFVGTALDQIRHFGAGNPHFAMTILERLGEMGKLLPPNRHPPLARQAQAVRRAALSARPESSDAADIERAAADALVDLDAGSGP
ncbi:MAG TPA: DUF2254 domain-containing protein [Longimicrobiales bacterium]|nr:DUF2254 domain-containing protein [Longimicrobiales bacterium]